MIKAATYMSSEAIRENDHVLCGSIRGTVIQVMSPGSVQAAAHDCHETGGFLIQLANGHVQLWMRADEDLILLGRS